LDWTKVKAYIELKDPTHWGARDSSLPRRIVDAVLPMLNSHRGHYEIISFNPEILKIVSTKLPTTPRVLALYTEWKNRRAEALDLAGAVKAHTVSLPDVLVTADPFWVEELHG